MPYNTLTMTFQTDFSNEERFTGFAAYYVAVGKVQTDSSESLQCSRVGGEVSCQNGFPYEKVLFKRDPDRQDCFPMWPV